jgi:hypothetical protein
MFFLMPATKRFGTIETGGTKVICDWANEEAVEESNPYDSISQTPEKDGEGSGGADSVRPVFLKNGIEANVNTCIDRVMRVPSRRIIIGGDVTQAKKLFRKIRQTLIRHLGGYVDVPEITKSIDEFIVPPKLGQQAGIRGSGSLVHPH